MAMQDVAHRLIGFGLGKSGRPRTLNPSQWNSIRRQIGCGKAFIASESRTGRQMYGNSGRNRRSSRCAAYEGHTDVWRKPQSHVDLHTFERKVTDLLSNVIG